MGKKRVDKSFWRNHSPYFPDCNIWVWSSSPRGWGHQQNIGIEKSFHRGFNKCSFPEYGYCFIPQQKRYFWRKDKDRKFSKIHHTIPRTSGMFWVSNSVYQDGNFWKSLQSICCQSILLSCDNSHGHLKCWPTVLLYLWHGIWETNAWVKGSDIVHTNLSLLWYDM